MSDDGKALLNREVIINHKTILVILSIITLIVFIYNGVAKINSYDIRLSQTEASIQNLSISIKEYKDEFKELNTKLTDLTIELKQLNTTKRTRK